YGDPAVLTKKSKSFHVDFAQYSNCGNLTPAIQDRKTWLSVQIEAVRRTHGIAENHGPRCHELRITDDRRERRRIYRIDADAVVVGDVFAKTTQKSPARVLEQCRRRFARYDHDGGSE